jgi:hypothetical protein
MCKNTPFVVRSLNVYVLITRVCACYSCIKVCFVSSAYECNSYVNDGISWDNVCLLEVSVDTIDVCVGMVG